MDLLIPLLKFFTGKQQCAPTSVLPLKCVYIADVTFLTEHNKKCSVAGVTTTKNTLVLQCKQRFTDSTDIQIKPAFGALYMVHLL